MLPSSMMGSHPNRSWMARSSVAICGGAIRRGQAAVQGTAQRLQPAAPARQLARSAWPASGSQQHAPVQRRLHPIPRGLAPAGRSAGAAPTCSYVSRRLSATLYPSFSCSVPILLTSGDNVAQAAE